MGTVMFIATVLPGVQVTDGKLEINKEKMVIEHVYKVND